MILSRQLWKGAEGPKVHNFRQVELFKVFMRSNIIQVIEEDQALLLWLQDLSKWFVCLSFSLPTRIVFPLLARLQRSHLQMCYNSSESSPQWIQAWSHSIRGHPDYRCKVFIITINHYHFHNHIMIIRQHHPCLDQFDFITWAAPRSCHRGWECQKAPTLAHIGMLLQRYRESLLNFRTLVK